MLDRKTWNTNSFLLAAATFLWLAACQRSSSTTPQRAFESVGAYVQNVGTTSAAIAVVTRSEERLTLELFRESTTDSGDGGVEARPARTVREPSSRTLHRLELSDLAPDAAYSYVVRDESGAVAGEGRLRTAPEPGVRPITFVVLGDSGVLARRDVVSLGAFSLTGPSGPRLPQDVLVQVIVALADADLVLHTGDLVYPAGERGHYRQAFFEPFGPLIASTPFYASIGNHDAATERAAPLLEVFHLPTNDADGSERFYSFDYGSAHFVCLDTSTSDLAPDGDQVRWLDADLAAASAPWKIAFFHVSPFSDALHGDNRTVQEAFLPVFERHGVDVVFSGHDHNYQRFHPMGGVHYVVTGGGGAALRAVSPSRDLAQFAVAHHFVHVTADATTLILEAVDIGGRVIDVLGLRK